MCQHESTKPSPSSPDEPAQSKCPKLKFGPFTRLVTLLLFSIIITTLLFILSLSHSTIFPPTDQITASFKSYTLYSNSMIYLFLLSICRIFISLIALYYSYKNGIAPDPFDIETEKSNGGTRTKDELEEAYLEESLKTWFARTVRRPSFIPSLISTFTVCFAAIRACARLTYYIGSEDGYNYTWWVTLAVLGGLIPAMECFTLDQGCVVVSKWGQEENRQWWFCCRKRRNQIQDETLADPLLSETVIGSSCNSLPDVENGEVPRASISRQSSFIPASDITSETAYKAGWTDLIRICAPDVHLIMIAFVALIFAAIAQVFIPQFTGNILDALINGTSEPEAQNKIWAIPAFARNVRNLIIAAIACGIFSGLRGSIFTLVGGRVNARLRTRLMDSLLAQEIGFFDVTKTGDITSRLCTDTTSVGDQVTLNVNVFLRSLVQAIGVLIFMFTISWQLTLIAFVSVPFNTILAKWYGEFLRKLTKVTQKKLADANTVSEAALSSMSTVRAFGAQVTELHEYELAMEQYLKMNRKSAMAYFVWMSTVASLPQLVIAIVLLFGGMFVQSDGPDRITGGQLVSFLLYMTSLSDAFDSIGYIFSSLFQAIGAADKIFELMHRRPRVHGWEEDDEGDDKIVSCKTSKGISPEECSGNVSLENVHMYYPARPYRKVLDGMSLTASSGAVVALVGPSGGGKSSVVSLIQNLYTITSGRVCIDGIEVHELTSQWLSRHVSVVSQEPTLYARSIRKNIAYGLEGNDECEPTFDEIKEAAKLANASDFIENLPDGYETDVGERGVQLSGGQKQRIAIARALVRKPRVLLLDEATSALDAESEALVQEAIDDMLKREGKKPSMTVIIVAHRLSTVRNADIIYVVKEGKVVEKGKHDELIGEKDGVYFSLVNRQMLAQKSLENGPS